MLPGHAAPAQPASAAASVRGPTPAPARAREDRGGQEGRQGNESSRQTPVASRIIVISRTDQFRASSYGSQPIAPRMAERLGDNRGRFDRREEQETQATTQRQPGHRAHQGDVQQHDCDHHRHQRRYAVLRLGGDGRLQGQPQEHAVRRPARGGSGGRASREVRPQGGRGSRQGPGSGRESAITALQAAA